MSGEMADPLPENIEGEKAVTYSHQIEHRINWGYVAIGLAAVALAVLLFGGDAGEDDRGDLDVEEDDGHDGGMV